MNESRKKKSSEYSLVIQTEKLFNILMETGNNKLLNNITLKSEQYIIKVKRCTVFKLIKVRNGV